MAASMLMSRGEVVKPRPRPAAPTQPKPNMRRPTGTGSPDDPFRGFDDTPEGMAAFQEQVPVGAHYVAVDPKTGQPTIYRRTQATEAAKPATVPKPRPRPAMAAQTKPRMRPATTQPMPRPRPQPQGQGEARPPLVPAQGISDEEFWGAIVKGLIGAEINPETEPRQYEKRDDYATPTLGAYRWAPPTGAYR